MGVLVQEGSAQLESRKFLPLLYQLAARMSPAKDPFQRTLHEVLHDIDSN